MASARATALASVRAVAAGATRPDSGVPGASCVCSCSALEAPPEDAAPAPWTQLALPAELAVSSRAPFHGPGPQLGGDAACVWLLR